MSMEIRQRPARVDVYGAPGDVLVRRLKVVDGAGDPIDITSWEWETSGVEVVPVDLAAGEMDLDFDTESSGRWSLVRESPAQRKIIEGARLISGRGGESTGDAAWTVQLGEGGTIAIEVTGGAEFADAAERAAQEAAGSAEAAAGSAAAAEGHAGDAQGHASSAEDSALAASDHRDAAQIARAGAVDARDGAEDARASAEDAAGTAVDARDDAYSHAQDAAGSASDAGAARDAAEGHAQSAAGSAQGAEGARDEAQGAATDAASSASSAASAAGTAQGAATLASGHASDAEGYRDDAEGSAVRAEAAADSIDPTPEPEPGRAVSRDDQGRARFADPEDDQDAATRGYVDSAVWDRVQVVEHGLDPDVPRPGDAASVVWIGVVRPAGMLPVDRWHEVGLTLDFRTSADLSEVVVPLAGGVDVTVDWGDGSPVEHFGSAPSHDYGGPGRWKVRMYGTFEAVNGTATSGPDGWTDTLTGIRAAGDTGVTSLRSAFWGCGRLAWAHLSGWDTSQVTNLQSTFRGCQALASLDLSGWDTSQVTTLQSTFRDCQSLTSLDLSGWDTSQVTTLWSTFHDCQSLTSLDVAGWDTSQVTNLQNAFRGCGSLTTLDVADWDISQVTVAQWMLLVTTLDTDSYDALLAGWGAQQVQPDVSFYGGNATYSEAGEAGRDALLAAGWTITDGGPA